MDEIVGKRLLDWKELVSSNQLEKKTVVTEPQTQMKVGPPPTPPAHSLRASNCNNVPTPRTFSLLIQAPFQDS